MQLSDATSWTWFVRAVSLCYQRPTSVVRRMTRYSSRKGQGAFLQKLANEPDYFGKQLLAARNGRESSAPTYRREAQQAAALLPLLAKDALDSAQFGFRRQMNSE